MFQALVPGIPRRKRVTHRRHLDAQGGQPGDLGIDFGDAACEVPLGRLTWTLAGIKPWSESKVNIDLRLMAAQSKYGAGSAQQRQLAGQPRRSSSTSRLIE